MRFDVFLTEALKAVVEKCTVGASVREICILGDKILSEETGKQFKKEKELKKGKST